MNKKIDNNNNYCFVYVTVKNNEQAKLISSLAIKNKLCACANIFPNVHSIFEWEGKIEINNETILILKTIDKKFEELKSFIEEKHTYDTPCIVKIDISDGNQKFLNWIGNSLE